jgi:hypothetical protein
MTIDQIIRAALPGADDATVEHVLWGRTHFPFGPMTPQYLFKKADGFRRAEKNGRRLCDFCHRLAVDGWNCRQCKDALRAVITTG